MAWSAWSRLKTLPLPSPQNGSGKPWSLLQEAQTEGMHRCGLKEAQLQSLQGSPSKGKCGAKSRPKQALQETLQAGMLAAQEGAPIVLRDSSASMLFGLQRCRGQALLLLPIMVIMPCGVAVMVAVIAPHGAIAAVVVVMSLWPHHPHAIGTWRLD
jgi:hypothetical protein